MYSSPTTFIANLVAVMQVLMTLDMPLSTTMALPVTSKPIESTVENLAWQAWIELPPEQKQQVKSRKVTPKSIFTLPLRVECPEGQKQVDSKCIPIAIGSNDVLIDLNALGLLVGSTQAEDMYDYDDMGEELSNPLAFSSETSAGEAVKTNDGLTIDNTPPAKDEPLKFNIFQNKFHIFHEEPMEDYGALSNEGLQSSEKDQNLTNTTPSINNATSNVTVSSDSVIEVANSSENANQFLTPAENSTSLSANTNNQSKITFNLGDDNEFKIDAISVPAFGNHSSVELMTTIIDAETTTTLGEQDKPKENDLLTLLQTESFLPLLNHTTATTTLQSPELFSLTMMPLPEPSESSSDTLSLGVDEEITTLPSPLEQNVMDAKTKQEFTRSVTLNPLIFKDIDNVDVDVDANGDGDNDQLMESTLKIVTNDEPLETTTPTQVDETTSIESLLSLAPSLTRQQELKELLLQQEQARKHFEALLRMRKGQKVQQVVLKKSKVQPVEVLSTTTESTITTTTAVTTAASLPTAKTYQEELFVTTIETATPLLTVHNENENNDRFYYQHFTKQDDEVTLRSAASQLKQNSVTENVTEQEITKAVFTAVQPAATGHTLTTTTTTDTTITKPTETKTIPLTSEIDLAEELRVINELVKGIRKPIKKIPTSVTTTEKPVTATTTTTTTQIPKMLTDNIPASASSSSLSESSSAVAKKPTLTTSEIWSKIMPLLTTSTTTTPMPQSSANESFSESQQRVTNDTQTLASSSLSSSSVRSNRNSKIIRINGFNKISAAKFKIKDSTTQADITATASTEESTPSYTTTTGSSSAESSSAENLYEPYWWLPISWRLDKPTSTEKPPEEQNDVQPLLLRFWSAFTPKSS